MATLEKIRQRGVLLTCIIGLALFLFIFTGVDFNSLFGESRTLVGEVNGEQIEIAEFEQRVEEAKAFFQIERGEANLDEQTTSQIRETVWNMWLQEVLYGQACQDAGITVSDELYAEEVAEYAEYYGYDDVAAFEKDNKKENIEFSILAELVMEFLVDEAVVVEPKATEE